ncbi:Universal stress protein A [Quillaja saponaria]|uniref:Universal stress protein A n=1 Tax=Quillaja saponaria TaxID=32244 RepID=A0AAD7VJ53_QUISA|nr:Universal stress protein A [Quillaja saponaria]KAJ7977649.1 Universal stress protein A [Quillaja saponaria]
MTQPLSYTAEMERKERKIVVAVDESEESMYALSWCISNLIADATKNKVVLLYVKPPPPIYSSFDAAGYIFSRDVISAMTKYTNDLVSSVMERAEATYKNLDTIDVSVERIVGSGDAKDVICSVVEKLKADTLVMGSHGYGFFKRALLGSVSDHCAKHAKCPVVIVKHP